eukprot:775234-Pyramimonas_sp.AAC.1
MATQVDLAIEKVTPDVESLLSAYRQDGKHIRCFDGLMDVFSKFPDLKWTMQMQSKYVACHNLNRGTLGVLMGEALITASKNIADGYSFKRACDGCYAVQCPPGTDIMKETL